MTSKALSGLAAALAAGAALGVVATRILSPAGDAGSPEQPLAWPQAPAEQRRVVEDPENVVRMFDSLNAIVAAEVAERRRLEEELAELTRQVEALRGGRSPAVPDAVAGNFGPGAVGNPQDLTEFRRARFIEAGFDEARAGELARREDEITMKGLYLRDRATREGWANTDRYFQEAREIQSGTNSLRSEFGDEDYERYLYAMGRPNRVGVRQVLETSPAQKAGLKRGDAIVGYDGQRIFSVQELIQLSSEGSSGQSVSVDVVRDGQRVQLWMPRGPLGFQPQLDSINPNE